MIGGLLRTTQRCFLLVLLMAGACATAEKGTVGVAPQDQDQRRKALLVAEASRGAGRYSDALAEYVSLLDRNPDDEAARLGVADCYVAIGAARDASNIYDRLLDSSDPQIRVGATQGRGLSLLMQGDAESGHAHLVRAVAEDPSLWRSWNALGWYYDQRQSWTAAEEAYGRAAHVSPTPHVVYNNWGMSLMARGRAAEAAGKFRRALELAPDFKVARTNLQLSLGLQGKYREALAAASERDMPTALNNVGYAAMLRGDGDTAEKFFFKAVEDSPRFNAAASKNLKYLIEASTR